MAAVHEGTMLIKKRSCPRDHLCSAHGIVIRCALRAPFLCNGVGAIEGIVQTSPTRICRIERIASVHDRHD